MKWYKKILKFFHRHYFGKVIVSNYISYYWRDVIRECSCGKRKRENMYHDHVYPSDTTNISEKEMIEILNKK